MSDLIEKVTPLLAQLKNPEVERLLLDLAHKIEAKDQRILELTAMSQAGNVDELLRCIERLEAVVDAVREYERVDNTNARLNMRRKLAALEGNDE